MAIGQKGLWSRTWTIQELRELKPDDPDAQDLTLDEILGWFEVCGAAWMHDGNPKKPHARLTSGMCSNGYFNCSKILGYPNLGEILARLLARRYQDNNYPWPEWIIGSAYSAITFSYEVAKCFGAIHGFTEKAPEDAQGKRMVWGRWTIPAGSRVLQIEDLVTTGGTINGVRRAVLEGNPEPVEFLPYIGVLVHRPPVLPTTYPDWHLLPLIEKEVWVSLPEECPLCQQNSKPVSPKSHWSEMTGQ